MSLVSSLPRSPSLTLIQLPPSMTLQALADSVRRLSSALPSSGGLADVRLGDLRGLVPLLSMPLWLPLSFFLSAFSYCAACVLQALDGSDSGGIHLQSRDSFKAPRLPPAGMPSSSSASSISDGSSMSRALDQVLDLMTALPSASSKYNFNRDLAEQLLAENMVQKPLLSNLNRSALSKALHRTMEQLEACLLRAGGAGPFQLNQILRRCSQATGWATGTSTPSPDAFSAQAAAGRAEKLAQEMLWLVERLFQYGGGSEALRLWSTAPSLAAAARVATPRVQSSLVKLSALLVRASAGAGSSEWQAGGMLRRGSTDRMASQPASPFYELSDVSSSSSLDALPEPCASRDALPVELQSRLLLLWLPLMCRSTHAGDGPILSSSEKQRTEEALQRTILKLSHSEQEVLLSSWLHEYSWSQSDWPNLQSLYVAWCERARVVASAATKLEHLE